MPNQVRIPVQLRALTNGEEMVSASGKSVLEIIEDIEKKYPGVKERICEADGKVRRFVNIFVNEEDIRYLSKENTPTKDGDIISIIPSIAGGSGL
jgi:molybdopterin synthase sulfur carrier subunit